MLWARYVATLSVCDSADIQTVNKLLGDIKTRGLIKGSDADKPSPYGNGAPPKGLAGDLGLDKILKSRELLGMDGFVRARVC